MNCCLCFKAVHKPTNTVLSCCSIFPGAVSAARRSNNICFQVTFTKHFTADRDRVLDF